MKTSHQKLRFIAETADDKRDLRDYEEVINEMYEDVYEAQLWRIMGTPENAIPVSGRIVDENGIDTGITFEIEELTPMQNAININKQLNDKKNQTA